MSDDNTGFYVAPKRYSAHGRETIDRIRDELGDGGFAAYCRGQVIRYTDRLGLKGDEDEDDAKARWYYEMYLHVTTGGPDPRHGREDFQPYQRPSKETP